MVLTLPKDKSLFEIQGFMTEACSEVRMWGQAPSHVLLFRCMDGGKGLEMIICETHPDNLQNTLEYMSQPCCPSFKEGQHGAQSDEQQLDMSADKDKHKANEREESPRIDEDAPRTSTPVFEDASVAAPHSNVQDAACHSDAQHADEVHECHHEHYPAMSSQMSYSSLREAAGPTPRNPLVDLEAEILCETNMGRCAQQAETPRAAVADACIVEEHADEQNHAAAQQQPLPNETGAPLFNFDYSGKFQQFSFDFLKSHVHTNRRIEMFVFSCAVSGLQETVQNDTLPAHVEASVPPQGNSASKT